MTTKVARVGELAEQVRGVSYGKEDASATARSGYLPVLRAGNITDEGLTFDDLVFVPADRISSKQLIRKNDVLIAASSGSLDVVGKAARALADYEGGFGAFCKVLRPCPDVDPGYFAHFFRTPAYRRRVSALAAGANINNLRNEHLDEMKVPLPPLPEQRRIAEILDKADALRAKRRAALAQLLTLSASTFLDMFGDPAANPKGWKSSKLGDVSLRITKGESPKWQGYDYQRDGALFVTSENVRLGEIDLSDPKFIPLEFNKKIARSELKVGDLLVNLVGASIGRSCVFPGFDRPANVNQAVGVVTIDDSQIDPGFVAGLLTSEKGQNLLIGSRVEAARANISLGDLRELYIPLPPRELQAQYMRRMVAISSVRRKSCESAGVMSNLFASLQSGAFGKNKIRCE